MTKDEFMEELNRLGYVWETKSYNQILRTIVDGLEFCPVTAVCYGKTGAVYSQHQYQRAADEMGLDWFVAEQIADAADFPKYIAPQSHRAKVFNEIRDELQVATQ